jgi:hypothetical protein
MGQTSIFSAINNNAISHRCDTTLSLAIRPPPTAYYTDRGPPLLDRLSLMNAIDGPGPCSSCSLIDPVCPTFCLVQLFCLRISRLYGSVRSCPVACPFLLCLCPISVRQHITCRPRIPVGAVYSVTTHSFQTACLQLSLGLLLACPYAWPDVDPALGIPPFGPVRSQPISDSIHSASATHHRQSPTSSSTASSFRLLNQWIISASARPSYLSPSSSPSPCLSPILSGSRNPFPGDHPSSLAFPSKLALA